MNWRQEGDELVIHCPGKVNLFLEIAGPRLDGYHDLITILQAVDLCDEMRLAPTAGGEILLSCDHPQVPLGPTNLVLRAAEAIRLFARSTTGVRISLRKVIPVGGGMGGGSSNAAGALLGLNRFWNLGLVRADLHRIAATLGSDVNFFLEGDTALCTGRGEKVQPLAPAWPLHFVLVFPGMSVPTVRAFQEAKKFLTPFLKDVRMPLKALEEKDFSLLAQSLFNRLEEPVFHLYPELAGLKRQLDSVAPGRVLLSGSGSSLFCLCSDPDEAAGVEEAARRLGLDAVRRVRSFC
ncbi:MAG: 4-(cytidine 5'-diphospho)-2-C-methyl-D-erythritol kinase [Planctomycetes bacterium]|nr:4-(cytidine 5'-diphospho)-2-C-methyl-D-erythritol kinase [Planctomycetota bacterium]